MTTSSRARRARPSPSASIRPRALDFVVEALAGVGLTAEETPPDVPADLLVAGRSGRSAVVRLLAAAAPHHRGGRGSLGLHWMLPDTAAEFVAVVDLSRRQGWLIPTADFRARAQPVSGGRFHLDWIVVPLGRTRARVPDEHEFEEYAFERALAELAHQLA
ncbi:MAG: hypothetical protein IH959_08310 [Chloroflexi bacterium]|nr:hypothetical protein [Chloroflexota bacterium]